MHVIHKIVLGADALYSLAAPVIASVSGGGIFAAVPMPDAPGQTADTGGANAGIPDMAAIRAQFAAKDAEIAQLKQQLLYYRQRSVRGNRSRTIGRQGSSVDEQDLNRAVKSYDDNLRKIDFGEQGTIASLKIEADTGSTQYEEVINSETAKYKQEMRACVQEYPQILAMPGFSHYYAVGDYAFDPTKDDIFDTPGASLIHKLIPIGLR